MINVKINTLSKFIKKKYIYIHICVYKYMYKHIYIQCDNQQSILKRPESMQRVTFK